MKNKWKFYRASGKVSYFVDDVIAVSKKKALEFATATIGGDIDFAAEKGNIEILELKVKPLRTATKKEVVDFYDEEAWEG